MTALPSFDALREAIDAYQARAATADEDMKSCCAAVYGVDLVTVFLGDSYHPGGAALTRHLADQIGMKPHQRVLDIAAGIGTTALLLAEERNVEVLGVDLGPAQVAKATLRAELAGLAGRAHFRVGDAERLPLDEASFDAVISECAFCTFPDKPTAAREAARVLRPGGRLALADVWLNPNRLDAELTGLAGRVACIADAQPIDHTCAILEQAGFRVAQVERHDEALAATIERVQTRLRALRLLDLPMLRPFNVRRAIDLTRRIADVVARGDAGYMLLTAEKP